MTKAGSAGVGCDDGWCGRQKENVQHSTLNVQLLVVPVLL